MQFFTVSLFALVIRVDRARRTTWVKVVAAAAVFMMVRFLFVPPVFGLSPSMVTLSAPLSSMMPRPDTEAPLIDTPSAVGRMRTEVYKADPAPVLFRTAA